MDELRRAHEEPHDVHHQRDAGDRGGEQHAHEDDHRAALLASEVEVESGGRVARHEAHEHEQNHRGGHDAPAVFGRENAGSGEHDDHQHGEENLRLEVREREGPDAHADERSEDVGAFGGTEDVAVDELPAALFDGLDTLVLGLIGQRERGKRVRWSCT